MKKIMVSILFSTLLLGSVNDSYAGKNPPEENDESCVARPKPNPSAFKPYKRKEKYPHWTPCTPRKNNEEHRVLLRALANPKMFTFENGQLWKKNPSTDDN